MTTHPHLFDHEAEDVDLDPDIAEFRALRHDLADLRASMARTHRSVWVLAAASLLAAVLLLLGACTPPADEPATDVCLEDEPCWDCSTMGNRVCGDAAGLIPPATLDVVELELRGRAS